MIDLGLAILVGFSPILLLLLLLAALEGTFECRGLRGRRLPPLTPFVFVTGSNGATSRSENAGPPLPVLASDRERDGALRSISFAVGEGRLSLEEAEQRIDSVLRSRHRHELSELLGDLPARPGGPARPRESERSERPDDEMAETVGAPDAAPWRPGLLVIALVALIVAVTVQLAAGVWELWPIALAPCALWRSSPRAARPRRRR